jgi:uncharacterized Fe-S cluster-containing radical SAM superfamily protein
VLGADRATGFEPTHMTNKRALLRGPGFSPKEVLFAPTTDCNLSCAHCPVVRGKARLAIPAAVKFLRSSKRAGVERVGFTGGEPFLDKEFLFALTESAAANGLLFGMVTTNARWFKSPPHLRRTLKELYDRGYDGSFGVSADAFHGKGPAKPALFIETAREIWNRPDIARVIAVRGARDKETDAILRALAKALKAKLVRIGGHRVIRNESLFVPVTMIDLVPVGKAEALVDPWGKEWFREDFCRGPGHVFYVLPDGTVKPCCGYATDSERLTIGNIHKDTAAKMLESASRNPFVSAVFGAGLSRVRARLEQQGVVFPGATTNQCYFCHHVLTRVPLNISVAKGMAR